MPDPTSRSGQIPIVQAAKLLMITEQWVRQLIRKGYIEKVARGEVGLVNAVQGYIRFLKDEERRVSKSAAANAVQTARAREIELRIAKEEARLIDYDEAMAVLDVVVGTYKAQFAGLPARVTRDHALRDSIENEIDDIFTRVADLLAARAAALQSGPDADTAAEEDEP